MVIEIFDYIAYKTTGEKNIETEKQTNIFVISYISDVMFYCPGSKKGINYISLNVLHTFWVLFNNYANQISNRMEK